MYSLLLCTAISSAQIPLYYAFKQVKGTVFDKEGNAIRIRMRSRNRLEIKNCQSEELDSFFRTLILAKHGRKELEHLLTTSSNVRVNVSDHVGVMYKDGYYRAVAGLSGPVKGQSRELVLNEASSTLWHRMFHRHRFIHVYKENTIDLFTGVLQIANDKAFNLAKEKVRLFDWKKNEEILDFSMDTICIEPFMYPELLYRNKTELFYFAGLHEIYHTRPENIDLQDGRRDPEKDAIELERKAFKFRSRINKKKIRS